MRALQCALRLRDLDFAQRIVVPIFQNSNHCAANFLYRNSVCLPGQIFVDCALKKMQGDYFGGTISVLKSDFFSDPFRFADRCLP